MSKVPILLPTDVGMQIDLGLYVLRQSGGPVGKVYVEEVPRGQTEQWLLFEEYRWPPSEHGLNISVMGGRLGCTTGGAIQHRQADKRKTSRHLITDCGPHICS